MSWTAVGSALNSEAGADNFGTSLAMSSDGTIVAVGAALNDGGGSNSGHVRVFKWNGSTWNQLGADINGAAAADRFGTSVALSADGTVLAVGANQNDGTTGISTDNRGHVRIYNWNTLTSAWDLEQTFIGDASGDRFGKSVALSANGQIVAFGGNFNDVSGTDAGLVRVFYKDGSGNWLERGSGIGGLAPSSFAGNSISLSADGTILAIGAPGYNNGVGYTQVVEWNGTAWVQKGSIIVGIASVELRLPGPNVDHNSNLGCSVSLSSNGLVLAIGALFDSTNGWDNGRAFVYEWISGAWTLRGSPFEAAGTGDQFGESVRISGDGQVVAVGSRYNDGPVDQNIGEVRAWYWSGTEWVQRGSDLNGEAASNFFGNSLAMSNDGSVLAVGAVGFNGYSGKVYIYSFPTPIPCLPAGTRVLTAAGYKAVEKLTNDDLIVTSEGAAVPFKVYTTDITIATEKNAPYLIPAHTFGKFPVKDLVLSPNHAFQSRPGIWQIPKYAAQMYPAIKQVDVGKSVVYYHIETPDYFKDNLVVEGTTVESFAHEQLHEGQIVYSYSARYNGFIRSQAARQSQARLTK